MRLGVRAAVVGRQVVPGDVTVDQGRVVAVGVQPAGPGGMAVPGYVDLQVNGFAGVDFLAADHEGYRRAAAALAATGVTAFQPTFITSPVPDYWPALAEAKGALGGNGGARVIGVHLEGPFLSPAWPGAHDPRHIIEPDVTLAAELMDAGPVTYVTLAPERPGALEVVSELVSRGAVVAVGHCDADAAAAHAAFDRGAAAVTHIYNAQRRWRPRDPGVAGAALTRADVVVQAIVDHVHLAPETAYQTFLTTKGRFALVTDAVEAAGLGEGTYRLGGRTVHVRDGAARLDDGTLAGSALTMDQAVRNLVGLGASLPEAVEAAATVPARLLRRGDLGILRPGAAGDIVVLDDALTVVRTLVDGVEVFAA